MAFDGRKRGQWQGGGDVGDEGGCNLRPSHTKQTPVVATRFSTPKAYRFFVHLDLRLLRLVARNLEVLRETFATSGPLSYSYNVGVLLKSILHRCAS